MGPEALMGGVPGKGNYHAKEIPRAGVAERERMLREAQAEGAKLLIAREQEAKQSAERARIQALARAELESKKIVLSARKEVLDQVYAGVWARLSQRGADGAPIRALRRPTAA